MLKNITPGFYKMRNDRLACVSAVYETLGYCSGFIQIESGIELGFWTLTFLSKDGNGEHDLMERIK